MLQVTLYTAPILGLGLLLFNAPSFAQIIPASDAIELPIDSWQGQVTSVSQLEDVKPTDWAFSALRSLVERYGCIAGYPDSTFRGDRAMTRYEFAAGLSACLDRLSEITSHENFIPPEDGTVLEKLQIEFAAELATLNSRIDEIETRTATLESQQFATITKLTGLAIFGVNAGGFNGDRIIAPSGAIVSRSQPNPTSLYRISFDFNTSFTGTDLLKLRLLAASPGSGDNAAGFLEPNLGSGLDFAVPGKEKVSLARLYYTFTPTPDLNVTLGAQMVAPDFVDKNRYANTSFRDFSTQSLVNNFILLPRPGGAGGAIAWNPSRGAFTLRAVYVASSATQNLPENQQFFGGGGPNDIRLFPTSGGGATGGLFGDPYMGVMELEYAPSRSFSLRLQYSAGELLGSNFDVLGANFDLAITQQVGLFARYGYGSYPDTALGDIKPHYWSAGISLQDLLTKGDLAGIGVAQPFILTEVGNATQTNWEAFYNIPIRSNIRLTPLIQVTTHAGNQRSNGAIVTGTLRTVFSF
jgi:Carbohydrate-selective porin, OprB family/S-layer homology domain